jgi:RimJ/RimL family protein N-acetyltransferase
MRTEMVMVRSEPGNEKKLLAPATPSRFPAIILGVVLSAFTVAASPYFVGRILLLHRSRHNLEIYVYAVQVLLAAMTIAAFSTSHSLSAYLRKIFPTTREVSFALVTLCLSFVCGTLIAEGFARVLNYPFRPKWTASENPLARFDPEVGWSYIPNYSVTQEVGDDRRSVAMHFDDLGCRVADSDTPTDRNAPTALFVGDSFTFGHGVNFEDSFVGRLAQRRDFRLQVVNLGVQAYGTDQALLLLKRQFRRFNTRLVVLTFTNMQIERNAYEDRRIQYPDGLFLGTKPRFKLRSDGSLYLADTPVQFKDLSYSHLWAALRVLEFRWGPPPDVTVTRALIDEMRRFVEANGAKFVVVDWYDDKDFPWGLNVNVVRITRNAPSGFNTWVIPGDLHPDERGHQYAAEVVGTAIERLMSTGRGAE